MDNSNSRTVYLVDDDAAVRDSMRQLLESYGVEVRDYCCARDFLDAKRTCGKACLLLDLHMPGMGGLELLEHLRAQGSRLPVIVITGRSDSALKSRVLNAGALMLLDKPIDGDVLLQSIDNALATPPRC